MCRLDFGVKGQGHRRKLPENLVNTISVKPVKGILPNFAYRSLLGHRYADQLMGSKVKVTAGSDPKNRVNTIFL